MSKLQTTTSQARPASPTTGTIFHETDTNRLIFWDGTQYHVYNRDSLIQTTGGVDELHYPQGIYADSSATYYTSTSPLLHFDTSHMNGVDKTQVYGDGDNVLEWYDRTNNNYKYTANANYGAIMDLNHSSTMSGGTNTMPTFYNGTRFFNPPSGAPTTIAGNVTLFWVMQPHNTSNQLSPFPYSDWYMNAASSGVGTYKHMGTGFAANLGANPDPSWSNTGETTWTGFRKTVDATTGPVLAISRNGDTHGNNVWRPDTRGNHAPIDISKSTKTADIQYAMHTYDQYAYEIILYQSELSIAEVNVVKSYLQNKYEGLNADFFPTGGTIDLTDPV